MLNGTIIQVMISTHNKYDDHTQMMSNVKCSLLAMVS